jgi:ABC-type lipoprotein release transport system permease subunit
MLISVSIGVGLQIPNAANLAGYTQALFNQTVNRYSGHLIIKAADTLPLDEVNKLESRLKQYSKVNHVVSRHTRGGVLFRKNENMPVAALGIDIPKEDSANGFCKRLEEGRCPKTDETDKVIVGRGVADMLKLSPGDRVRLVLPYQDLDGVVHAKKKMYVAGILSGSGFSAVDKAVFLLRTELNDSIGWIDSASSMHIYLEDHHRAEEFTKVLRRKHPELLISTWKQENQFVAGAIRGNDTISNISTVMTILAVLVPILALLSIHVISERKQIATLKALGWTRADIFWLYFVKAGLIGFLGALLGLVLGLALCFYYQKCPIFSLYDFVITPLLTLKSILLPMLTGFLVTLLGGIWPAINAAGAEPATQLKAG